MLHSSVTKVVPLAPPVVPSTPATTLQTTMVPGCCGLKIVHKLACLGKTDALSVKYSEGFDELVKKGTAQYGTWAAYGKAPETIAIISTSPRYNKPEEYKKQVEFFKAKGWRILASWKSMESGGENFMWGSPGIKIAGEAGK